jgi:hypothetical protein
MRQIVVFVALISVASTATAVDFLGVELCTDRVDTGVILPVGSPLSLESAEVGRHGGLVLLLSSKDKKQVLVQVDDLMAGYVGSYGTGDERKLEWSSDQITAFAQVIQKGYVALAVTAGEDCASETEVASEAATAAAATAPQSDPVPESTPQAEAAAATSAAAAVATTEETPEPAPVEVQADFELKGRLKHSAAEDDWVDVMGVVVNASGASFAVASFDLSLYDGDGELVCVDTVSVNHLKQGQERAFRGSIRCADYVAEGVASWKLQFAGGH